MPILEQMDKGGKVEIYSGMLFSHKKKKNEGNLAICNILTRP